MSPYVPGFGSTGPRSAVSGPWPLSVPPSRDLTPPLTSADEASPVNVAPVLPLGPVLLADVPLPGATVPGLPTSPAAVTAASRVVPDLLLPVADADRPSRRPPEPGVPAVLDADRPIGDLPGDVEPVRVPPPAAADRLGRLLAAPPTALPVVVAPPADAVVVPPAPAETGTSGDPVVPPAGGNARGSVGPVPISSFASSISREIAAPIERPGEPAQRLTRKYVLMPSLMTFSATLFATMIPSSRARASVRPRRRGLARASAPVVPTVLVLHLRCHHVQPWHSPCSPEPHGAWRQIRSVPDVHAPRGRRVCSRDPAARVCIPSTTTPTT